MLTAVWTHTRASVQFSNVAHKKKKKKHKLNEQPGWTKPLFFPKTFRWWKNKIIDDDDYRIWPLQMEDTGPDIKIMLSTIAVQEAHDRPTP